MIESIEQGRKEDGNRSIADKIIKRLHDLEMNVDNNNGRWVWELLQNAKDSIVESERKVSVKIGLKEDFVEFKHNGTHFSEKDIRGLINQISSKEVEENVKSKQIGKFGTGFLTTHLLSKVIDVKSIIETADGKFYHFSFSLDRNGKTTSQLIPRIEDAWKAFHESTEGNEIKNYDENDFNTTFKYKLETKKQKDLAIKGIDEFYELVPYVLAFIPKIESVRIIDKLNNLDTKFENTDEIENELILNIIKTENNIKSQIKILIAKEKDVSIACMIKEQKSGYKIQSLKNYPKLFCDFPLIGTEDFHFPVIVNSYYFNPLTERDGVWLFNEDEHEVDENRKILESAVKIYDKLLSKITELDFYDYLNICNSKIPKTNEKSFNENWYKGNIQKPIRDIIIKSKVVETETGEKVLLEDVRLPDSNLTKEEREKVWKFSSDLKINILPAKKHIHKWVELIWEDICILDINDLVVDLKSKKYIQNLIDTLELDERKTIVWLNNCIEFILEVGNLNLFNDNELIPNQNGEFKRRKDISTDEINDETLKKIAELLGYNYYKKLIHKDITFNESHSSIDIKDIANTITKLVNDNKKRLLVYKDIYNNSNQLIFNKGEIFELNYYNDNYHFAINSSKNNTGYAFSLDNENFLILDKNIAIRKLTKWFDKNEENAKLYFSDLYSKKEKLFVDTIEDKENLYNVLKSKTPLSKLAEVIKAIDNDPEILNIIKKRQNEKEEEKERNKIGENIEKVLAEALSECGFEVIKEIYGKDLVITLKKGNKKYSIEVKSTSRESYVSMTPFQAKSAVAESENYALCVILKKGSKVDKNYIIENSNFVVDIGKRLKNKVEEVLDFESNKAEIADTNDDIDLFYENNLEYKYKISSNIWTKGKSFKEYINDLE